MFFLGGVSSGEQKHCPPVVRLDFDSNLFSSSKEGASK